MDKRHLKGLLAGVLSAAVIFSGSPFSTRVLADEMSGTVAGREETIQVLSDTTREREADFDKGWKFFLGDNGAASGQNFDDSSWKNVTLPHDFSISQNFTSSGEAESGFLPGGTGWYRKSFPISAAAADKKIILNFDGVYSDAYVYVNGTYVGENHYGYNNFAFDITDYLTCDGVTENVIAVKAVNNIPSSRWYSGSGIYRDVTLFMMDPVHVALNGTCVTTPNIANGDGTVSMQVEVQNQGEEAAEVTVKNTVYTSEGSAVSETAEASVSVAAGASAKVEANPVVSNPQLWSPDSPTIYKVRTEIYAGDVLTDTCESDFGFRWYSFDSNGFHLNGKNVKLNGVCLHHDQGALGSVASYDAMYRQLSSMKNMGVNAIRTSHNPVDKKFIDICNDLGLLVIEEMFDGLADAKNGNNNDFSRYFNVSLNSSNGVLNGSASMTWAEFVTKSVVRRDRNDPSIILWSLGNEIQEGTSWANAGSYAAIAQNFIDWIKTEDTTRKVTSGDNNRGSSSQLVAVLNTIVNNGGVVGFNYANSASTLTNLANRFGGVVIASETSSATNSRGIYSSQANNSNADGKYHLTSYDTSCVGWGLTAHDSIYNTMVSDCVAGEFVWTGWDYIGEPTPWNGTGSGDGGRGAVPNSSYFGIVDTAGFEKDTYYLYRSQWNQEDTTLHLVTAWDADNMYVTNGKTPVVIYSNAPKVELYRGETLIGVATRKVNTTNAGHEYYTYTTESKNTNICNAVKVSGSASLYATFNVAYEAGTISAVAYDANGKEIVDTTGNKVISTPGTPSKLEVVQNRKSISADGQSLVYIEVAVQDANGNLDTTATNEIQFRLSGNGEIMGVDNGDQATTKKYQQSSVLDSRTSAHIKAYAGKALVIVRATDEAGAFTVDVSSNGLTGGSASVTTNAVNGDMEKTGLISYTMVRDYSVKAGTAPEFYTTATGTMADDTTVEGTILWDEIPAEIYQTAGDYTIKGTLSFADLSEQTDITVIARLHVIADVIALRNVSAATMEGTVPTLPDTVKGVLADGSLSGGFDVVWEPVSAEQFAAVGDVVTVNGTATLIGDTTLPVTCTVRVAETVNTESSNIAAQADSLTQDCVNTSDNLETIRDGRTEYDDNTSYRWTNWANRYTSETASITLTWATAHQLSGVNLYFFTDNGSARLPAQVKFEYSLNGEDFEEITCQDVTPERGFTKTPYVFDKIVDPVALRITLTQQGGTGGGYCVGLTECEVMTYAGAVETNSSAELANIFVDGAALDSFAGDTLSYEASGTEVSAATEVNAGITILPVYTDQVVRILTISEDGSKAQTYEVKLAESCAHENTELRDKKAPTCTEEGYTGDLYCLTCGKLLEAGTVIPVTGHSTILKNAKAATCTEDGYTGDAVCTVCGETITEGKVIPASGHSWDSGVITKPATSTEEGIKTYTCTVCGATRTESIPKTEENKELSVPKVTLRTAKGDNGKIKLTASIADFENLDNYYEITEHGFIYISKAVLGAKSLTVNNLNRTKVKITNYRENGEYAYNMTPKKATTDYVVRAYVTYKNEAGKTVYVYSDQVLVSYNSAK